MCGKITRPLNQVDLLPTPPRSFTLFTAAGYTFARYNRNNNNIIESTVKTKPFSSERVICIRTRSADSLSWKYTESENIPMIIKPQFRFNGNIDWIHIITTTPYVSMVH